MADVFLSYASQDRDAAERVERALAAAGYEVFWDQHTPAGQDWDSWIRGKLSAAKVVVVLWSRASIASPNVRHEAIIARDAGKLVPALIEELKAEDFPMGLYLVQGVSLVGWRGDAQAPGLARLLAEIGARAPRPRAAHAEAPRTPPQEPRAEAPRAETPRAAAAREPSQGGGGMLGLIGLVAAAAAAYFIWTNIQQDRTRAAWRSVDRGSVASVRAFIDGKPGAMRGEAEALLAQMEERAYERAQSLDTVGALQRFVRDFPQSDHSLAARGRIAELRRIAETEALAQSRAQVEAERNAAPARDADGEDGLDLRIMTLSQ